MYTHTRLAGPVGVHTHLSEMQHVQNVLQTGQLRSGLLHVPVSLSQPLFLTRREESQVLPLPPESFHLLQLRLLLLQLPLQATQLLRRLPDSALQLLALGGESLGMDSCFLQLPTEREESAGGRILKYITYLEEGPINRNDIP